MGLQLSRRDSGALQRSLVWLYVVPQKYSATSDMLDGKEALMCWRRGCLKADMAEAATVCISELREPHHVQTNRQEDRPFRLLGDKWLSWAQDPSFVEQVLNCQIENMSHHGGREGCGCGERRLWCAGMPVGGERKRGGSTFRGGGKGFVSKRCTISMGGDG